MIESTEQRMEQAAGQSSRAERAEAEVLRLEGVTKRFGSVVAVDSVDLTVRAGETFGLLGANGAGKSTLFSMIGGQHRASAGTVVFRGKDVTRMPPERLARLGITRCFQVARAYNSFTVRENLVLAATSSARNTLSPLSRIHLSAEQRGRIEEAIESARLTEVADKRAADVSEGDRKRLDVARALVRDSVLLLLDEPTAGLSTDGVDLMIGLIREIKERRPELAVILTAHDLRVMRGLAGPSLLMVYGAVRVRGDIHDVLADPLTLETYLGAS